MSIQERLNPYHMALLIYMTQVGVVLFSIPRITAENFGTNGWISVLIFCAVAALNIALFSLIFRVHPKRSIFEIAEDTVWKPLVYPAYAVIAIVLALTGCMVGKQYILMIQMSAFPTTSPMVLKFAFDLLALLLLVKGIYNIAKAATIWFYMAVWMVLMLLFHLYEFEWARLTPFLFRGDHDLFSGGLEVWLAFVGYELCLFLVPFAESRAKVFRAVQVGNLMTTAAYLLTCIVSYGFYSFQQLTQLRYPFMDLLAYVRLPFVERIENLLFTIMVLKIMVTTVVYYWIALQVLTRLFPKMKEQRLAVIMVLTTYAVSFIPELINFVELWLRWLGYTQIGFNIGLPVLLLLLIWLKKLSGKGRASS